jgi:hypothetical protein|tara:strand:+ start:400 stop:780 length:381 start_codon:yes stop_codon:yes gene_type:complete
MAHFADLDASNIVTRVLVVNNDVILDGDGVEQEQLGIDFLLGLYSTGRFVQTSYNHNFRKQYAGKGFTYDAAKNIFIQPRLFPSWSLDENDDWQAPENYPDDDKRYCWNEGNYQTDNTTGWVEIEN